MSGPSSNLAATCRLLDRWRRHEPLPVVLCVDVEPDLRVFDRDDPQPWRGFEYFLERLPDLRRLLTEQAGSSAITWFLRMDPQIAQTWGSPSWIVAQRGDTLAQLVREGDELGLHTHTWRWDEARRAWFADYADEAWAEECLAMGLEAFESAFGQPCQAHRGGDHFLCGSMLALLAEAGVEVDLTVEPGWPPTGPPGGEPAAGELPDFRNAPTRPYRSGPTAFPAADPSTSEGPLLIPLYSPPAMRRRHRLPLPPDSRHFVSRLAFEMLRETPPVLALVLRSDAALDSWDLVTANLGHLARHRGVRFVTASAAAALLSGAR